MRFFDVVLKFLDDFVLFVAGGMGARESCVCVDAGDVV